MGPITAEAWPLIPHKAIKDAVRNAAHILVPEHMFIRLSSLVLDTPTEVPFEGRLPFPDTVVEIENRGSIFVTNGHEDGSDGKDFQDIAPHGKTFFYALNLSYDNPMGWPIMDFGGAFANRTVNFWNGPGGVGTNLSQDASAILLMGTLDLLFSFMAEPRFVKREPISALRRERSRKVLNLPRTTKTDWIRVSWTLGSEGAVKSRSQEETRVLPFHMRRAHWRHYDRPTLRSEERPGFLGHWVWVEAYYAGNPAVGEIQHHYEPKLDYPGKSSALVNDHLTARFYLRNPYVPQEAL